jgi:hypothetical protein
VAVAARVGVGVAVAAWIVASHHQARSREGTQGKSLAFAAHRVTVVRRPAHLAARASVISATISSRLMAEIVYVLSNKAMHGLVKIGYTSHADVRKRVGELSSATGVPWPFDVEYACEVPNGKEVEAALHTAFAPYRYNPKREFFTIDAEQAVAILKLFHAKDATSEIKQRLNDEREQDAFFQAIESWGVGEVAAAKGLVELAEKEGLMLQWMGTTSFRPVAPGGVWPFAVESPGTVRIPTHKLTKDPPLSDATKQAAMRDRFASVPGAKAPDDLRSGIIAIPLATVVQNGCTEELIAALKWLVDEVKQSPRVKVTAGNSSSK